MTNVDTIRGSKMDNNYLGDQNKTNNLVKGTKE
jgi:hypothetical protein